MGLGDAGSTEIFLREGAELLRQRPGLGILVPEFESVREEFERVRLAGAGAGLPSLTPAEARLLPLLTTHFSFREIGEQLFVSPHTVKTQAISIYRKLGVSSRGAAIDAARTVGLLAS
jgi:LuxR family maltose regulon positive regulatory protein